MAKSTKKNQTTGKLAGKTVAFVGKFGYRDMFRSQYASHVVRAGGKVVDAATTVPDYLFVGEGRGGKPPADIAKLQKKSPTIQVLDSADFVQLLLPDREALLREIAKGHRSDGDHFWVELEQLYRQVQLQIDLQKTDLKKVDLYGAHLEGAVLTGSDLREANVQYTQFGDLERVKFDGCDGQHVYLCNLQNCTFRSSDLEKAWMFYSSGHGRHSIKINQCDFTSAKMAGARMNRGTVSDCKFVGADLSDAEMGNSVFENIDFTKADMSRILAKESKFDDSNFSKANLTRANLRKASLVRVDLRNANLREAVLNDADLTGANIAGADFQDAVLTGANLQGLDISKAKNLKIPVVKAAGKKLLELAAAAAGAKEFITTAEVDLGQKEFARLQLSVVGNRIGAISVYHRERNDAHDSISAATFEQGMLGLADRWPKATLRLDSIKAKGSKTLRGQKLREVAVAAWAESFGVPVLSAEELKTQREDQQAAALSQRDALMKQIRDQGAKVWNSIDYRLRRRIDLRGADLSGAQLDMLSMQNSDLKDANFAGSSLVKSEFAYDQLANAVFTGANLENSKLQNCALQGANFRDAVLTGADLTFTKLMGADFTGASLKDTNLFSAQFDETTVFPSGFKPADDMIWKGEGPRPGAKKVKAAKVGSLNFDTFLEQLGSKTEVERMKKAGSMLKAERFQLFAEVKEDSLLGIVKSQSNKELVYSCRLTADGAFGCCTQNLRPCGGLRGALCKHLLVLVIGLAKAGQIDAALVDLWINLSKRQKPAIDEESMSATFLRYKGAEAGEVDWRPTETIPEDFYAM